MKKCNKFMLLFILGIGMLFSSCVYAEDNDPSQAISKDWVSTLNLSTLMKMLFIDMLLQQQLIFLQ